MYGFLGSGMKGLLCLVALMSASSVFAQAPRSTVDAPASSGVPEFRDPKTGQIWTPNNVGLVPGPNTPADRAFDPLGQAARVDGVVVQRPKVTPLGAVPITAGPTVPVVNIENASLRAVPERRWQVMLYLNNNSARTVAPLLHCSFTNGGKPVEETRVLLPAVGAGVRVGLTVHGPKTNLFVDRATCRVESP
ncbi:MAG: hypothetical protein Q8K93_18525 [Reyranella sp.]|uniref:hypothetical protein n=1 Tax=Reyranella sp. TaxID=1929291 RepID=UPI0027322B04|nr:hypothetical protein [Reyranella sp.]MDP1964184.1 hypothetical protein [Reyranella sp.]MDP2373699.1 hypothetical protein [Reyranella sp.]